MQTFPKKADSACIQNTQSPVDKSSLAAVVSEHRDQSHAKAEWCRGLEENLVAKLQWASQELAANSAVEESTRLCLLIKSCAEALKSVRNLDIESCHEKLKHNVTHLYH